MGSGFRVQGVGSRVQGSGFRVQGVGSKVQVLGFRLVWGSGFRYRGTSLIRNSPSPKGFHRARGIVLL